MTQHLYRHFDSSGELLYVGISGNTAARLAQHAHISDWFLRIKTITIDHLPNRDDALRAERKAIKAERPLFNRKHFAEDRPPYVLPYKMRPEQARIERANEKRIGPRTERIVRLRAAGETWRTIGQLLGITRQRAQQIAAKHSNKPTKGRP